VYALPAVQVAFGAACAAVAVPLIVQFGPAANVSNATSVRILGGALLAFAVGALATARDPRQHRVVLRMEIVFTGFTTAILTHRLLTHEAAGNRALYLLPPVLICFVLLLVLYPRANTEPSGSDNRPGG
jgi:RsiW-degrading membrane proteinase PrsW (M82 family)